MTRVKPQQRIGYSSTAPKASTTGFFSEYMDTIFSHALLLLMLVFLFYAPGGLLWHYTNSPSSSTPYQVSELYLFILLPAMIWIAIDMANEKNAMFSATGFGSFPKMMVGMVAGAVCFILFDYGVGLSFFEGFLAVENIQLFFFIVFVASFVEEVAFRGAFQPMLTRIFESGFGFNNFPAGLAALLIVSVAFGLFHWQAYGANLGHMAVAIMFGVAFSMGNYFFKTLAFSFTWHVLHNGWGYYQSYGFPRLPTEFLVVGLVIVGGLFILALAKVIYGFEGIKRDVIRS